MTTRVIDHLRQVVLRDGVGLGDGELLRCFIERRDESALAALVKRHGPMVWGACRRLLSHHDAEDAFQATFLVLVRKAASIVPREMVGNWLYGVAHQTALQARRNAARRSAREVQVPEMPDTVAVQQDQWLDVQPLLDQELNLLPDNYRAVLVLCDLEGRTRKEVARQLGVPEGSVQHLFDESRISEDTTHPSERLVVPLRYPHCQPRIGSVDRSGRAAAVIGPSTLVTLPHGFSEVVIESKGCTSDFLA